jgi:hypothetical protein
MAQWLEVLAWLSLAGCLQVSTGTDVGPGAGGAAAARGGGDAGTGGTNCQQDPQSGVILCEQIDICAGVSVDTAALPNCGFELHAGAVLDLECLCGDALCPIGVPATCDQAKQLLGAQTELLVCQQVSEGRCLQLGSPDAGQSGRSDCLKKCQSDCAGVPGCVQLCGC